MHAIIVFVFKYDQIRENICIHTEGEGECERKLHLQQLAQ